MPIHYLNQGSHIVNWSLGQKSSVKFESGTFYFNGIHLEMSTARCFMLSYFQWFNTCMYHRIILLLLVGHDRDQSLRHDTRNQRHPQREAPGAQPSYQLCSSWIRHGWVIMETSNKRYWFSNHHQISCLQSPSDQLFVPQFVKTYNEENMKDLLALFWREPTDDWWFAWQRANNGKSVPML